MNSLFERVIAEIGFIGGFHDHWVSAIVIHELRPLRHLRIVLKILCEVNLRIRQQALCGKNKKE
jgi:hypothetical protein